MATTLGKNQKVGKIVVIKVRYADFSTLTKRMTLDKATADFDKIDQVAKTIFDSLEERASGIRLLGVTVTGLEDKENSIQLDI